MKKTMLYSLALLTLLTANLSVTAQTPAQGSRKVKVVGERNTGGLLDYGNAMATPLPSGERRMHVPTTRSRRLPAMPLDLVGILPDIRLPKNEPDPTAFARRYLKSAPQQAK